MEPSICRQRPMQYVSHAPVTLYIYQKSIFAWADWSVILFDVRTSRRSFPDSKPRGNLASKLSPSVLDRHGILQSFALMVHKQAKPFQAPSLAVTDSEDQRQQVSPRVTWIITSPLAFNEVHSKCKITFSGQVGVTRLWSSTGPYL
jgi:hypothetical protein